MSAAELSEKHPYARLQQWFAHAKQYRPLELAALARLPGAAMSIVERGRCDPDEYNAATLRVLCGGSGAGSAPAGNGARPVATSATTWHIPERDVEFSDLDDDGHPYGGDELTDPRLLATCQKRTEATAAYVHAQSGAGAAVQVWCRFAVLVVETARSRA